MGNSISTTSNTQTPTNSTPAHQALNGSHDDGLSIVHSTPRQTIDMTTANDDEVILIPSIMLSDIACDINGAVTALRDIGELFNLIYQRKITPAQAVAMARMAHNSVDTWISLLYSQLEIINEPLAMTVYGKEIAQ